MTTAATAFTTAIAAAVSIPRTVDLLHARHGGVSTWWPTGDGPVSRPAIHVRPPHPRVPAVPSVPASRRYGAIVMMLRGGHSRPPLHVAAATATDIPVVLGARHQRGASRKGRPWRRGRRVAFHDPTGRWTRRATRTVVGGGGGAGIDAP